ncbi:VWA domain-containing protein [Granulosicoccus sp. 3-233]|uniref:VWA domain-containing protein n=1 Tax=Granulosicoccus sp. 3-233 TaxID=3417969 RepID=UPI003D328767
MSAWQWNDWSIQYPGCLVAAALLLIGSLLWPLRHSHSHWRSVLSPALFDYLGADRRRITRCNLPLLLASIVTAGLSQPVQRQSDDDTWRHSIGWIAVADVSRSMTLNDTVPSRLAAMRAALTELSHQAAARPIALILFAGDAFLVAPPAFDHSVFNEQATLLEYGIVPLDGSNLTRALSLASSVVEESRLHQARILVLGDSGGIGNGSIAAARFLGDAGHRVDMLVFGSSSPPPGTTGSQTPAEPVGDSWSQTPGARDTNSVQWKQARALADAGNGRAVRANSFGVIDYTTLDLDQQATASTHDGLKSLVWRDQSHWLLLLAIPGMLLLFSRESAR